LPSPDRHAEFIELFSAHHQRIYGYIYALLLNINDADDVAQQVNLVLWDKFDEYQPGTHFVGWACRVAQLKIMEWQRAAGRQRKLFGQPLQADLLAEVESQDEQAFHERQQALSACMDKLSQQDRSMLVRCYCEEVPVRRIAEELSRPVTSVYNSLRRIRQRLLACVKRTLARARAAR